VELCKCSKKSGQYIYEHNKVCISVNDGEMPAMRYYQEASPSAEISFHLVLSLGEFECRVIETGSNAELRVASVGHSTMRMKMKWTWVTLGE
jgi:hypothetical protein